MLISWSKKLIWPLYRSLIFFSSGLVLLNVVIWSSWNLFSLALITYCTGLLSWVDNHLFYCHFYSSLRTLLNITWQNFFIFIPNPLLSTGRQSKSLSWFPEIFYPKSEQKAVTALKVLVLKLENNLILQWMPEIWYKKNSEPITQVGQWKFTLKDYSIKSWCLLYWVKRIKTTCW